MKSFACQHCSRAFKSELALADHSRDSHSVARNVSVAIVNEAPTCIECGSATALVTGEAIYPHRPDLYSKKFWLCECGAYCGCHGVTERPLGNPCGSATRHARMAAHRVFDPIWKSREMGRREAYTWLSEMMGLAPEQTHIGMFTRDQALEVVRHCRERRRVAA